MIGIVGSCCVDELLYVDFLPSSSQDARILQRELKLGGCAYYVAKAIPNCVLVSSVGIGYYGDFVVKNIVKEDLDFVLIPRKEENGVCICEIEKDGQRTFLSYQGAEYDLSDPLSDELEDMDWLYLSGIDLENNMDLLDKVKDKHLFISCGPRHSKLDLDRIFSFHPILHMNRQECEEITGLPLKQGIRKLYDLVQNVVFVTDGQNGSYGYDGKLYYQPSVPVVAKNSVGAGDSHAGVCLKGVSENCALDDILIQANAYAAKVLESK